MSRETAAKVKCTSCDCPDCGAHATKESPLAKSGEKVRLCDQCFTRFARRGLLRANGLIIEVTDIN